MYHKLIKINCKFFVKIRIFYIISLCYKFEHESLSEIHNIYFITNNLMTNSKFSLTITNG